MALADRECQEFVLSGPQVRFGGSGSAHPGGSGKVKASVDAKSGPRPTVLLAVMGTIVLFRWFCGFPHESAV